MPDKQIQCVDCPNTFVFTESEQGRFKTFGFTDPKRCHACRAVKKEKNLKREQNQKAVPAPEVAEEKEQRRSKGRKHRDGGGW